MSRDTIDWAYEQHVTPAARKFVLVCLGHHADHRGENCFPGQALIAAETSQSERTVRNHLKSLEAEGIIGRQPRYDAKGRRSFDVFVLIDYRDWLEVRQRERAERRRLAAKPAGSTTGKSGHDYRQVSTSLPADSAAAPYMNGAKEQDSELRAREAAAGGAGPAHAPGKHEGPSGSLAAFWRDRQAAIVEALGGEEGEGGRIWRAWLAELVPVADDGEAFTLAAPSAAIADYVGRELAVPVAAAIGRERVALRVEPWVVIHLERERRRGARTSAEVAAAGTGEDAA